MIVVRGFVQQAEAEGREHHGGDMDHGLRRIAEDGRRAGEHIRAHFEHQHEKTDGQREPHGAGGIRVVWLMGLVVSTVLCAGFGDVR
jgi:hypothetical protein